MIFSLIVYGRTGLMILLTIGWMCVSYMNLVKGLAHGSDIRAALINYSLGGTSSTNIFSNGHRKEMCMIFIGEFLGTELLLHLYRSYDQ